MKLIRDYRKTTSGDVVSMLLNIYDSKEVFVKELQIILAGRLLSSKDYDVEKEVSPIPFKSKNIDTQHRNDQSAIRRSKYTILRCNVERYHRIKTSRQINS